jgi:hypothetical protein
MPAWRSRLHPRLGMQQAGRDASHRDMRELSGALSATFALIERPTRPASGRFESARRAISTRPTCESCLRKPSSFAFGQGQEDAGAEKE